MTVNTSQLAYAQSVGTTSTQGIILSNRDPTVNDISYRIGQFWTNTTDQTLWYLNSQTTMSGYLQSLWIDIAGNIETLTGNTGGAVSPLNGNINIVGDGSTATVVGNPSTNTLTITAMGGGGGGGLTWQIITANQALVASNGYIASTNPITLTLPTSAIIGATIEVQDPTGNGFTLQIGGGETAIVNGLASTTAGTIISTAAGCAITLISTGLGVWIATTTGVFTVT